MMMLGPSTLFLSFLLLTHTNTDMHTLLMGFHNKWILHSSDASHKSMALLPDLLSFTRMLTHPDKIVQTETRRLVYLSHIVD